jgi:hypothetical protein
MIYKKEFASQFLSWVDTPDELSNYGVLSDKIKDKDSSRVKKFFNDTHSYVDYIVVEEVVDRKGCGQTTKKTYMMTPDVFKMCLLRCKNTRKYADYYLILEKVFVYYHRYQQVYDKTLYTNMLIDKLTQKVDEQTLQINTLLGFATDAKVAKADTVKDLLLETADNSIL